MPPDPELSSELRINLDGWVVLPDVLAARDLVAMREAFERAAVAQKEAGGREGGTRHITLDGEPAFAVVREYPRVLELARHIIGRDFGVLAWGGRDPLPGFGQQGLHADWRPRAAWEPYHVTTALWLLDDFTPDNGATRLVPGSHRKGAIPKAFAEPGRRHPDEKIVLARAGSVLVFNGHLWHSGTQNRSRGPRRVIQCQFAADELRR